MREHIGCGGSQLDDAPAFGGLCGCDVLFWSAFRPGDPFSSGDSRNLLKLFGIDFLFGVETFQERNYGDYCKAFRNSSDKALNRYRFSLSIVCADCAGMSGRLNKNAYLSIGLSVQEGV